MKKIILIILLIITLSQAENYKYEATCGFLYQGTLLTKFKESRIALKSWVEELIKKNGGKATVNFYEDERKLFKDLKKNKLDMVVLTAPYFFKNKEDIYKHAKDFWSLDFGSGKYIYYYLIGKNDTEYRSFKNLKNKTLSIQVNDGIGKVWLDKNIYEINKVKAEKILKKLKYEEKESSVVLNVYFDKSDYAIINKRVWDDMLALNPSIVKKVKIIEKTDIGQLNSIGLFSKNTKQIIVDSVFKIGLGMKEDEGYKNVIDILENISMYKLEKTDLDDLIKYYDEYFKLEEKYN
ncbi:PhnD/SsuA/transferrin family substrate-binding protein [Halarcobacter sp.]|uniref:PhnD/SsuA/transferrin family substrate-binding protein n=1 Tax=Halarcobacter sp. TaxID=2321133 RepID=UPI002AAB409B|nr:PhnD/SsuA/transferrin family substrate-binding protein [Halarcobacter sp.]